MDFSCPKCTAKVKNAQSVGCPACGFGKPHTHEERRQPVQKPVVETPPGYSGGLLTEDL
jgi:ribosomal protein L37E